VCYGTRHTLQARVWEDIDRKADRLQAASATRSMAAMYQRHAAPIEEYVHGLPATEGQTGAIFAVNGEIAGMDLFDSPATLSKLLPKVVRSYALDALDAPVNGASAQTRAAAVEFLQAVEHAEEQRFPAIGMGEEIHLSGDGLAGAALVVEGRVIHLAAFRVTRGFGGSGFGVQGE
jgi:ARG/rhodanese/phosphatase superfamily protein